MTFDDLRSMTIREVRAQAEGLLIFHSQQEFYNWARNQMVPQTNILSQDGIWTIPYPEAIIDGELTAKGKVMFTKDPDLISAIKQYHARKEGERQSETKRPLPQPKPEEGASCQGMLNYWVMGCSEGSQATLE